MMSRHDKGMLLYPSTNILIKSYGFFRVMYCKRNADSTFIRCIYAKNHFESSNLLLL